MVLGHSYGGLVAQLYLDTYPDDVLGLVLVCSAVSPGVRLLSTRQYDFLSEEELRRIHEIGQVSELSDAQRLYNRFLNGDWKRQSFYRPTEEEMAEAALYEWVQDDLFRPQVLESYCQLELEGASEPCSIPTLIIEGGWDLPWNADKPSVLHSGHSPFEDEPEAFFRELESFVSLPLPPDGE